jgi:sugar/nucleoside kinase (ribokinase family)
MEIVGIGNALMDVIAFVDEEFAPSLGFHNNTTTHLERERLDSVLSRIPEPLMIAGGGAANTTRVAALLGIKSTFLGSIGEDRFGELYRGDLESDGVTVEARLSPRKTGVFLSLTRPDGGRTVLVAPGAALDVSFEPPPPELFRRGAILYLEGFLLRDRGFFMACLESARQADMDIAIDLASYGLVGVERGFLLEIVPEYASYLFANEDEFCALADLPLEEGLDFLADSGPAFVVKLAERGAVYAQGALRVGSPVRAQSPLDSTGAGDAFAAGFLAGVAKGFPPERCLRLGNRIAEEVIRVPGLAVDTDRLRAALTSVSA